MVIQMEENFKNLAKIKVIGVGGAGGNAINRMVNSGFSGVEFIAVNTDALALDNSLADVRLAIGQSVTKGLGAGAKPETGFLSIQEDREKVAQHLEGADMVFITAGMGGGTGTGAAPVVAEIAREMGILSVAVVTRPFMFEGPVREKNSKNGLKALREHVDTIIVIQNQKILSIADKTTTFTQAFAMADDVLTNAVRGISEIILRHGDIQVDFADVKAIMEDGGDALMGTGIAEGENRAIVAAERAIHSQLLEDISIQGASGLLVNISGGSDLGIMEINEAMSYIYEAVGEDNAPNIIFGTVVNKDFEKKISVTVIATGFASPSGHSRSVQAQETKAPEIIKPVQNKVAPVREPELVYEEETPSINSQEPLYQFEDYSEAAPETPFNMKNLDVRSFVVQEELETETVKRVSEMNEYKQVEKFQLSDIPKQKPVSYSAPFSDMAEEDTDWDTPAFLRNQDH